MRMNEQSNKADVYRASSVTCSLGWSCHQATMVGMRCRNHEVSTPSVWSVILEAWRAHSALSSASDESPVPVLKLLSRHNSLPVYGSTS
eukprot:576171-Amphidinium_carterae.2